jgi:hypothetical protein
MAPKQTQQPPLRPQQPGHNLSISRPQGRIDGAVASVLDYAIATARRQTGSGQGHPIEQISLQPAQLPGLLAIDPARLLDRFSAEVEANHVKTQISQKCRFVTPATTRDQHLAGRSRRLRVLLEKPLQRRRG